MNGKATALWLAAALAFARAADASDPSTFSHAFSFDAAALQIEAAGGYASLSCPGSGRAPSPPGFPALPAFSAMLLLPDGTEEVSAVDCTAGYAGDFVLPAPVAPIPAAAAPGFPHTAATAVPDGASYAADAFSPHLLATSPVRYRGGHPFVSVTVTPLSWRASDLAARFATNLVVTLALSRGGTARALSLPSRADDAAVRDLSRLVANPAGLSRLPSSARVAAEGEPVDYLIVTSASLTNAFAEYAAYRASRAGGGYAVAIATTDEIAAGWPEARDLQESIRLCISNHVAARGTRFVLLGGDDSVVPDRDTYGNVNDGESVARDIPCDLYYADCLSGSWDANGNGVFGETDDGAGMVPDVYLGRLPVRSAFHVAAYLGKLRRYESQAAPPPQRILFSGNKAWHAYTSSSRPSDDVTGDGHLGFRDANHPKVSDSEMWMRRLWRDGIAGKWTNAAGNPGYLFDTLTSWDGTGTAGSRAQTFANIRTAAGEGFLHMVYSGHGHPGGFELEDTGSLDGNWWLATDALTNVIPFFCTDACLAGAFDGTNVTVDAGTADEWTYEDTEPCFAEAHLRNPAGGFLAFVGAARYGWGERDYSPADPTSDGGTSVRYEYKFFDRFLEAAAAGATLGEVFNLHKADMLYLCEEDGPARWVQFALNLLGDPALAVCPATAPEPPPELRCTGTNATRLDFAWSASTNEAAAYRFQLGVLPTVEEPVTLLLSESFEDGLPEGWTTGNVDVSRYNTDAGSYVAKFNATNDWLATPLLDHPARLSFSVCRSVQGKTFSLDIEVLSPEGELLAAAGTVANLENTSWHEKTIDLSAFSGRSVRIRFRETSPKYTGYLDAVAVEKAVDPPLVDETVSAASFAAEGLAEDTTYYARVRTGESGRWSAVVPARTLPGGTGGKTVLAVASFVPSSGGGEGACGVLSLVSGNWPSAFAVERTTNLLAPSGGWELLPAGAYVFTNGVLSFPADAALAAYRLVAP